MEFSICNLIGTANAFHSKQSFIKANKTPIQSYRGKSYISFKRHDQPSSKMHGDHKWNSINLLLKNTRKREHKCHQSKWMSTTSPTSAPVCGQSVLWSLPPASFDVAFFTGDVLPSSWTFVNYGERRGGLTFGLMTFVLSFPVFLDKDLELCQHLKDFNQNKAKKFLKDQMFFREGRAYKWENRACRFRSDYGRNRSDNTSSSIDFKRVRFTVEEYRAIWILHELLEKNELETTCSLSGVLLSPSLSSSLNGVDGCLGSLMSLRRIVRR